MPLRDDIIAVQAKLGLETDGIPGAVTWTAIRKALVPESASAPIVDLSTGAELTHNVWPKESDAADFFGYPPNLTSIELPYPMHLYSAGGQVVTHVTCNLKVAASLRRILTAIKEYYKTPEALHHTGVDVLDGIVNDRYVRGSSTKRSMHAYGAAIDINAEQNPRGSSKTNIPPAVVAIFKAEGWRWGGDYKNAPVDSMHFEACV